ncbi:hypothetical protein SporoP37_06945 [Sporosarcina sp. P37]|uniref:YdhK family protein n=1 Tax=unclassified Sporosarcina TaxID=2647733 RepID=UPI000A17CFB9|nr:MULTISPECIES: YdhK family protein [unclassified Sporosarcina]ARK26209.1 hypothetical protein SporoP37_06945 [Sporosarcina sp. P37]PID17608.1 DUF1541 domain-containing protein [Sporosarcina sp. P35]
MKKSMLAIGTSLILVVGACGANTADEEKPAEEQTPQEESPQADIEMEHASDGEVPEGLQTAEDPAFPVGSKAVIETDHMPGMKGAEATIVGAYDTVAYVITYTPADGGEKVKDHKWVVHEEIEGAGEEVFEDGAEVTVLADHMEGMQGAEAVIESSEDTTVYMIDYMPTTGGDEVKNHKWVVNSELSDIK